MKQHIKQLIAEYTNQFIGSDIVNDIDNENAVEQNTLNDYLKVRSKEDILELMMQYIVPVPDAELSQHTMYHRDLGETYYKFDSLENFIKFLENVNGNYTIKEWKNEQGNNCVTAEFNKNNIKIESYDKYLKCVTCFPRKNRFFITISPAHSAVNIVILILDDEGMNKQTMDIFATVLSKTI